MLTILSSNVIRLTYLTSYTSHKGGSVNNKPTVGIHLIQAILILNATRNIDPLVIRKKYREAKCYFENMMGTDKKC